MKALTLAMGAFGPYRDKQEVDFTTLGEESIFLITGPTGAGKTTIFDAMCFALYGRASGSDRDQDSMRSHFADPEQPTYVDFLFELRGKTYRILRMPKQLKKKERGEGWKEEPARADLFMVHDNEEKVLSSKIKEVNEQIEAILGLDYEQFRKMIMIPQGEFRKLISENSKEREEILQRIFKTEFFANLTEHFKKEAKTLEDEIHQFEWKITQEKEKIHWGEDHDESLVNQELSKVRERLNERILSQEKIFSEENNHLKALQKDVETLQAEYYKAKQLRDLFQEKDHLYEEKHHLDEKKETISQMKHEYALGKNAAQVKPMERQYEERKKEVERLRESQATKEENRKQIHEEFLHIEKKYKNEVENEENREHLKRVWQEKEEEKKHLKEFLELSSKLKMLERETDKSEKAVEETKISLQGIAEQMKELKDKAKDERRLSEIGFEKKQHYQKLKQRKESIERLMNEWNKLKELRSNFQSFMKQYQEIEKSQKDAKVVYENAMEEIRKHHAYTLALDLDKGTPCPVCGSKDHDAIASRPAHVPDEKEMDHLKEAYDKADQAFQKAQGKLLDVKSEGEAQRHLTESLQAELSDQIEELSKEKINEADQDCLTAMKRVQKEHSEIEEQRKEIQAALEKLEKLENQQEELRKRKESIQKDYYEKQQNIATLKSQSETLKASVSFTSTDPAKIAEEASKHEALYEQAEKRWQELQAQHQKKRDEWHQIDTAVEEGRKYIEQGKEALKQRKEEFDQTLVQYSFASLEDYQRALRSDSEMEKMNEAIQHHQQRLTVIAERISELDRKLSSQEKPDLPSLEEKAEEQRQKLAKHQELVNHLNQSLNQNLSIRKTITALVDEQGELAAKYYDIAELAQLARGDNHLRLSLERYVLASYLDEILMQANLRLDQMTDHRYQLIRSDAVAKRGAQSGLDLEVIDHHTGQQRSVRTLSGGEGFKTSLSLALGMADVVQAHAGGVQLDTLFIDEGFGTLDEVSLEQAIACLRGLQDGSRMLGIISHVPQLKEEIPAKLQIHAGPSGSTVDFVFQ